jgi:ATP-dependent protease Clp ATPase subunit
MSATDPSKKILCSFCGQSEEKVNISVHGAGGSEFASICDECIYLSLNIISSERVNLRAAYFGYELIAKLLSPVAWLADQLHLARK